MRCSLSKFGDDSKLRGMAGTPEGCAPTQSDLHWKAGQRETSVNVGSCTWAGVPQVPAQAGPDLLELRVCPCSQEGQWYPGGC